MVAMYKISDRCSNKKITFEKYSDKIASYRTEA